MEIGLREILIVIGVIIIGIILLDGYRRMRRSHKNSLSVSWELGGKVEGEADDAYGSELPNGGARPTSRTEPGLSEEDLLDPIFSDTSKLNMSSAEDPLEEDPYLGEQQEMFEQPAEEPFGGADLEASASGAPAHAGANPNPAQNTEGLDAGIQTSPIQEVIIINVVARDEAFRGDRLLEALLSCGMRFGRMNIFHRHEKANGEGAELFSMANIHEPGVFDIHKMDDFETKGVCMFMSLPGPKNSQLAFDLLVDSARKIANSLGGEMRDENHSVMTQQTIEHYRQRVIEFERKQISRRAVTS